MDQSRYTALFLTESRAQLGACGQALLDWERTPDSVEPVTTLFRAMHTFKGMAAAMGFANLTELAHRSETLLDTIRRDPSLGHEHRDLLFRAVDALEASVEAAVAGGDSRLDFAELLTALDHAPPDAAGARHPRASGSVPSPAGESAAGGGREVQVAIRPEAVLKGARAMIVLRLAEGLGRVSGVRPPLAALEREDFDGRLTFQLISDLGEEEVRERLLAGGEVAEVLVRSAAEGGPGAAGPRSRQIRLDLSRLDAIMSLVGELMVARGRLNELVDVAGNADLRAAAARIGGIVGGLYDEVIQARLTPVWQVFERFPRVVRDLGRQLGRRVRCEVEGGDTQLDRAVLDELGEPLIHLFRNAVDHGIEPPEERRRQGKAEEGLIRVSASSEGPSVVVRVADDGQGIDRARILAAGLAAGLVPAGTTTLSDDQVLRVLARPGFSTAGEVTEVSGRGIGLDAVVARIRALGGQVELTSTLGQGTVFTLRLPMTVAVVRALLARVGEERYAIPAAGVAETIEIRPDQVTTGEGGEAYRLRDELLTTVRLRDRLGVKGARPPGHLPALVVEVGERRAAVVVDALLGQQEIVVEPFDAPRGMLPVFSGATILGDGAPALIVDPGALV